jgi:hypothetical protein
VNIGTRRDSVNKNPPSRACIALNPTFELQQIARAVRRIGSGYHCDPESILIAKDSIAHRLMAIAGRLEAAGVTA